MTHIKRRSKCVNRHTHPLNRRRQDKRDVFIISHCIHGMAYARRAHNRLQKYLLVRVFVFAGASCVRHIGRPADQCEIGIYFVSVRVHTFVHTLRILSMSCVTARRCYVARRIFFSLSFVCVCLAEAACARRKCKYNLYMYACVCLIRLRIFLA